MRFALLIWQELADDGSLPASDNVVIEKYLADMRADGLTVDLVWFHVAPSAQWTDGEPHDAAIKGRGPRPPSFDAVELYRRVELTGILSVSGADEETALLWASRFPFIVSVEVRRVQEGDEATQLSTTALNEIARGYWMDRNGIAAARVDRILQDRHDVAPALLRALAMAAPAEQLPMIGVGPLETMSMDAEHSGVEDRTLELLLAAEIPAGMLVEILSGPWPHYLVRWRVADRLRGVLSDSQYAQVIARLER